MPKSAVAEPKEKDKNRCKSEDGVQIPAKKKTENSPK